MIIEHSGDFKVVDPKTKEVRYDSNCNYLYGSNISLGNSITCNNTVTEEDSSNYWEKSLSKKDQILELLKGETYCDILQLLTDVELEVRDKLKY